MIEVELTSPLNVLSRLWFGSDVTKADFGGDVYINPFLVASDV